MAACPYIGQISKQPPIKEYSEEILKVFELFIALTKYENFLSFSVRKGQTHVVDFSGTKILCFDH